MNILNFYKFYRNIFINLRMFSNASFFFIERFLRQAISLSVKIRIEIIKGTLIIARRNGTKTFL